MLVAIVAKCQVFLKIEPKCTADDKREHLRGQIVDPDEISKKPQEKEVYERC